MQRQQQQQHRFRTGWRASLPGRDWVWNRQQLGQGRELLRAGPADPRVRFPQGWGRRRRGGDSEGKKSHPVTLRFIASSVPLATGLATTLLLCHQTHTLSAQKARVGSTSLQPDFVLLSVCVEGGYFLITAFYILGWSKHSIGCYGKTWTNVLANPVVRWLDVCCHYARMGDSQNFHGSSKACSELFSISAWNQNGLEVVGVQLSSCLLNENSKWSHCSLYEGYSLLLSSYYTIWAPQPTAGAPLRLWGSWQGLPLLGD